MTVIAIRDGVMAGDGRVTSGKYADILTDRDVKVYKIGKYLLGVAGSCTTAELIIHSMRNDYSPGKLKGSMGMRFSKSGGIEIYDEGPMWWPARAPYFAIGIADMHALLAMDMGATAVEAVRAACKRSASCGGKITKVEL